MKAISTFKWTNSILKPLLLLFFLSSKIVGATPFYVGVGGFEKNGRIIVDYLKNDLHNVNAFSVWITREWQEYWYPAQSINAAIAKGYTPIFIFYYFADDISRDYVLKKEKAYYSHLRRFIRYLQKIKGTKIVILNPEYNENGVANWSYFDRVQLRSIQMLKKVPDTKVGICPGDFGNYKKIWDATNWNLYIPSMRQSAKASDFIAFQEMRALTRNSKEEIALTPLRALAFSIYLHSRYNKPTLLAYLAISSCYDPSLQKKVVEGFVKLLPLMKHGGGLIGLNFFHYFDDPKQQGYFKECEQHFGLRTSQKEPKPALYPFRLIR